MTAVEGFTIFLLTRRNHPASAPTPHHTGPHGSFRARRCPGREAAFCPCLQRTFAAEMASFLSVNATTSNYHADAGPARCARCPTPVPSTLSLNVSKTTQLTTVQFELGQPKLAPQDCFVSEWIRRDLAVRVRACQRRACRRLRHRISFHRVSALTALRFGSKSRHCNYYRVI